MTLETKGLLGTKKDFFIQYKKKYCDKLVLLLTIN